MSSVRINLLRLVLWPSIWSTAENVSYVLERNVCSVIVEWIVLVDICLVLLVYSFAQVFYILVLLPNCSTHYLKEVLKLSYYYCWIAYFSFQFLPLLLHVFWDSVRCICVYNCYILLMGWPFYYYLFFFSNVFFILKAILSDINIVTASFLCCIINHPLPFK